MTRLVVTLGGGLHHSLAAVSDGSVWVPGFISTGPLGLGTNQQTAAPTTDFGPEMAMAWPREGQGGLSLYIPKYAQGSTYLASSSTGISGTLTWNSGENAGRITEVLSHGLADAIATLTLLEAPVLPIAEGDGFNARAGCDKRIAICSA